MPEETDVLETLKAAAPMPEPPPKPVIVRGRKEAYGLRLSYSVPEEELLIDQNLLEYLVQDAASILQLAAWGESVAIDILDRFRKIRDYYLSGMSMSPPEEYRGEE